MKIELKNKIIRALNFLVGLKDKEIEIKDFISTKESSLDRHHTTFSTFNLKIEDFGVRTSGGIARIEGSNQQFEFRVGNIFDVELKENLIIIRSVIQDKVFRQIEITKKSMSDK
jgi:hypothetical protein